VSVTISPTVGTVNAADKPYAVTLSATIDFTAADYVWTVDGNDIYAGYGGSGTLPGPAVTFDAKPKTVLLTVVRQSDSVVETDTYTTADQRPAPSISVSLLTQKDGVPITDSIKPTAPTVTPVAGETQVDVGWSYGAAGQNSRSDVAIRVSAADETGLIDFVRIAWGDGNWEDVDGANAHQLAFDLNHTYTSTTGSITITGTVYRGVGGSNTPGTLGVTIPQDATGWRASQYKITRYQDQLGFKETAVVGWRGITGEAAAFRMYGMRRQHTYFFQVQLRETDPTGRPLNTSSRSDPSSVGPW
jgi:hypothetical protein